MKRRASEKWSAAWRRGGWCDGGGPVCADESRAAARAARSARRLAAPRHAGARPPRVARMRLASLARSLSVLGVSASVCPARPAPPRPQGAALAGRAWLSSYYLVFLACFLDLAESSKKAHGTARTPQLRTYQKEGWHQKQSDLQGNQGRHEPARMCSLRMLRRRRAS